MPIWSLSRAELDVLEDLEYAIEKGNAYLLRNMLTLKDLTGARSFVAYSGIEPESRTLLHKACIARAPPRVWSRALSSRLRTSTAMAGADG